MSREVGLRLQQARVAKKLTVDDVADRLKIRKPYIESIEDGDFKDLPGMAYVIGFVRSYAALVGLNPEEMIAEVRNEVKYEKNTPSIDIPPSNLEASLPSKKIIAVSLIILAIAYVVWTSVTSIDNHNRSEISSLVVKEDVTAVVKDAMEAEKKMFEEETLDSEVVSASVASVAVDPLPPPAAPENNREVAPQTLVLEVKPKNYGDAWNKNAKIVITVKDDAWIQMQREGEILFSKVLLAGDRYFVSDYDGTLVMDTGNAGGMEIEVSGRKLGPIGSNGIILRGFTFDKSNLDEYLSEQ